MAGSVAQGAFSAGEISPELFARTDMEKYRVALALAKNFFIDYKGGAVNRAGTQFCGFDESTAYPYIADINCRVIPFIYSNTQSYALVLSPLRIRFISDGGYVVEASKAISGATKANPGVITCNAHGFAVDDLVYCASVGGMTELNGRWFRVNSVPTANTLTLKTQVTGTAVDTTAYTTYTSGGTLSRAVTVVTPYTAADISDVKFVQSADVMTFFHSGYAVRSLTRNSHTSWTFASVSFAPSISAPTGVNVSSNINGSGTDYTYVVTAVSAANGDESVASSEDTVNEKYWTGTKNVKIEWNAVSGARFYKIYRQPVVADRTTPGNALFGLVGATRGVTFYDQQLAADYSQTPPEAINPFNASGKYPRTGTYHQQRLMFAASINYPNRVWGSVTASFSNMNQSIPTQDTDSLEFQLASQRIDPVENLLSMPGGLLCFTAGGVYHVSGDGQNAPITPSSIVANQQTFVGAASLSPLAIDYNIMYSQVDSNNIRQLVYNFFAQTYESKDITDLAQHLFREYSVVDWAYAGDPWKVIWAIREDGRLLSCTFYDKADMYAWAWHETDGFVKSVCAVPENGEMVVYLTVVRRLTPTYEATSTEYFTCIERMKSRIVDNIFDAWFVDSGLATTRTYINAGLRLSNYTGTGVTATALGGTPFVLGDVGKYIIAGSMMAVITGYTSSTVVTISILSDYSDLIETAPGVYTPRVVDPNGWSMDSQVSSVSGLTHLAGKSVVGLADGAVIEKTVSATGTVTLDVPATYVVLGLPRLDQIQNVPLEFEPTAQGKRKRIPACTVRVYRTRGVEVGQDFDNMEVWPPRDDEPMGQPPSLITGDRRVVLSATWDEPGGQVCVQQRYPLPAQILGIVPEIEIGDS